MNGRTVSGGLSYVVAVAVLTVMAVLVRVNGQGFNAWLALVVFTVAVFLVRNLATRAGSDSVRANPLATTINLILIGLAVFVALQAFLFLAANDPFSPFR